MTDLDFAKQLVTYADAVTGFSWTQTVVFCFAIARSDSFTKTVTKTAAALLTTVGIVLGAGFYVLLVSKCIAGAASLDPLRGKAGEIFQSVQRTRILVILGGGLLSLFALWATRFGESGGKKH